MSGRHLSPGEDAEIRAAYELPMSLRECAAKFGHNAKTAARAVVRADGTLRPPGRPAVTGGEAAAIRHAYSSGLSAQACSQEFACGHGAVLRVVERGGGTVRPQGPQPSRADPDALVAAWDAGLTVLAISKAFRTRQDRVSELLREAGVPVRNGRLQRKQAPPITETGAAQFHRARQIRSGPEPDTHS
jgi:hypothetical protein